MGNFVCRTILALVCVGSAAPAFAKPASRGEVQARPARAEIASATAENPKGGDPATEEGELPLVARGAVVIDAYTGGILYEKEVDTAQFPASTTKILTALLVIEEGDLEREIEITEEDSKV